MREIYAERELQFPMDDLGDVAGSDSESESNQSSWLNDISQEDCEWSNEKRKLADGYLSEGKADAYMDMRNLFFKKAAPRSKAFFKLFPEMREFFADLPDRRHSI